MAFKWFLCICLLGELKSPPSFFLLCVQMIIYFKPRSLIQKMNEPLYSTLQYNESGISGMRHGHATSLYLFVFCEMPLNVTTLKKWCILYIFNLFVTASRCVCWSLTPSRLPLQTEPAPESASTPATPSSRPLSPRQRRAQNRNQNQPQRRPTYPAFPAAAQQDGTHTGSAVLIVLLTLALAALVFRRIYLAQDYKFDYEL